MYTTNKTIISLIILTTASSAWFGGYLLAKSRYQQPSPATTEKSADPRVAKNLSSKQNQSAKQTQTLGQLHSQLESERQENSRLLEENSRLHMAMESGNLNLFSPCGGSIEEQAMKEAQTIEMQRQQRLEELESQLLDERKSPDWNDSTTLRIDEIFRQLDDELSGLIDVDCRANLCRIETEHPDETAMKQFLSKVQAIVDMDIEIFPGANNETNKTTNTVIFLIRPGIANPFLNNAENGFNEYSAVVPTQ